MFEKIQLEKLSSLIEKAKSYGGILAKDAIALENGKHDHLSTNDKIRWLGKACENAIYCGQYEVVELETVINRTPLI